MADDKKKIGFQRVDALPTWSENIVGDVFFVAGTGIYVAIANGTFELSADVTKDTSAKYELSLDDNGCLHCIKNGTDNGFTLTEGGVLKLA